MSGDQGAFNKLSHGEILGALHDGITWLKNRLASLPSWTQKFIAVEAKPEATILEGLVPTAVNDIIAGGFTTAAFVKAGKDVLAQLIAQNVTTYTMQSVMANLNMAVATDPNAQAALAMVQQVLPLENAPAVTTTPVVAAPSPFAPEAPLPPTPAPVSETTAVDASGEVLPANVAAHSATVAN